MTTLTKPKYVRHFTYLMRDYEREFKSVIQGNSSSGLNGARILISNYKGHMVLRVIDDSKRSRSLRRHADIVPAGRAWLYGDDIDGLIAFLRDAKKFWLSEYKKIVQISKCKACEEIPGGVCNRHRDSPELHKKRRKR